jgi:ribosomal protein S18 acetylase RimI-like enzyme
MKQPITFRPITADDEQFLYRLYAGTRQEELAQTAWTDAEKETFLRQQFTAQHKFYMERFAQATFEILLLNKEAIGRLYIDRRADEIRIIDIAILPEHRNKGIGSSLLKNLLTEAHETAKPLRIHVEKNNPALKLYERLGFREIQDKGVYYLMECSAEQ